MSYLAANTVVSPTIGQSDERIPVKNGISIFNTKFSKQFAFIHLPAVTLLADFAFGCGGDTDGKRHSVSKSSVGIISA